MNSPMRRLLLIAVLFLYSGLAVAAQDVGGIVIDYNPPFQTREDKARAWQAKMSEDLRSLIERFEIFEAPPSLGLGEVRLLKIRYVARTFGTIDAAASETVRSIAALPGITNVKQSTLALRVSGLDARRVSFESDRNDGKLGAEFLIIHDKRTNTAFQLQIIFAQRQGMNPFGTVDLITKRAIASSILSTVSVSRQ